MSECSCVSTLPPCREVVCLGLSLFFPIIDLIGDIQEDHCRDCPSAVPEAVSKTIDSLPHRTRGQSQSRRGAGQDTQLSLSALPWHSESKRNSFPDFHSNAQTHELNFIPHLLACQSLYPLNSTVLPPGPTLLSHPCYLVFCSRSFSHIVNLCGELQLGNYPRAVEQTQSRVGIPPERGRKSFVDTQAFLKPLTHIQPHCLIFF